MLDACCLTSKTRTWQISMTFGLDIVIKKSQMSWPNLHQSSEIGIRIETRQNVIHTSAVHEGEKHALCVRSEKEEKKCDSSLRFIDNLWGEKIISALKSKLIIYGTCLNKKKLPMHHCTSTCASFRNLTMHGDQKISCMWLWLHHGKGIYICT